MKTLTLLLYLFGGIAFSQPDVKLPFTPQPRLPMSELSHKAAHKVGFRQESTVSNPIVQTRADSICAVRGHIKSRWEGVTLLNCPPRTIDLPDRTIRIYWDRNTRSWTCERCRRTFRTPVQDKPDTVIIWRQKG